MQTLGSGVDAVNTWQLMLPSDCTLPSAQGRAHLLSLLERKAE
ncbi:hypothetical protein AB4305_19495 [Nocardia sp. 2YAB30]